jgi:hypothetical protein
MRISLCFVAIAFLPASCEREEHSAARSEQTSEAVTVDNTKATKNPMNPMNRLEHVMGTLLETWEQRYTFVHDREEPSITFEVPGFTLKAVEEQEDDVALVFEEAGTKHRVVCNIDEAPRVIEALLFPDTVPE